MTEFAENPRNIHLEPPERFQRSKVVEFQGQPLSENDIGFLAGLYDLLTDENQYILCDEIRAGRVTLAMIRPHAEMNRLGLTDEELYQQIKSDIENEFRIQARFSLLLSPEFISEFYDYKPPGVQMSPKDFMQTLKADKSGFENKWQEFSTLFSSGPSTIFILRNEKGDINATKKWRDMIGVTNPEKQREIEDEKRRKSKIFNGRYKALRAKYAVDLNNNLFHGSDSPEAVVREVGIIAEEVMRLLNQTSHTS